MNKPRLGRFRSHEGRPSIHDHFKKLSAISLVLLGLTACNRVSTSSDNQGAMVSEKEKAVSEKEDQEHGHLPGAHGGIIVSLGQDRYHVEAVFEKGGLLRLYTLGTDESRVMEIDAQSFQAFALPEGTNEATPFTLKPSPQPGDSKDKTSLFVGEIPAELVGKELHITVPNIAIGGDRFRLGFSSSKGEHDRSNHMGMPDKIQDDEERSLYLQPGGHYTADDIVANGKQTASERFRGIKATHDMKTKPGDRLCPISGTKANPKFSWIIGGHTYQFCCPPCVDEFLTAAKAAKEPLPLPDEFIKQ